MKGLDTNVLVRYLVRDDKRQADRASAFIRKTMERGESCFISHVVLCELVWVLESAYGFKKKQIVDVLGKILVTKQVEIQAKDIVWRAVHAYAVGKGDLADYLTGLTNQAHGCDLTATFDHELQDSPAFILLD
jgi:predicted nucleic-acid-binding protein